MHLGLGVFFMATCKEILGSDKLHKNIVSNAQQLYVYGINEVDKVQTY